MRVVATILTGIFMASAAPIADLLAFSDIGYDEVYTDGLYTDGLYPVDPYAVDPYINELYTGELGAYTDELSTYWLPEDQSLFGSGDPDSTYLVAEAPQDERWTNEKDTSWGGAARPGHHSGDQLESGSPKEQAPANDGPALVNDVPAPAPDWSESWTNPKDTSWAGDGRIRKGPAPSVKTINSDPNGPTGFELTPEQADALINAGGAVINGAGSLLNGAASGIGAAKQTWDNLLGDWNPLPAGP
jgi:hypothetical protein